MKLRYRAGDVLFREGDPSTFACLILSGTVEVRRDVGSDSILLGTIDHGDLVGEMGVLEGQPRSATVIAVGDVELEMIAADRLVDWICANSATAGRMMSRLCSRVRSLSEQLIHLHTHMGQSYPGTVASGPAAAAAGSPAVRQPATQPVANLPAVAAPVDEDRPPRISIRCAGAAGNAVVSVETLPFMVGRRAPEVGQIDCDRGLLVVDDRFPYRVSVSHFVVDRDPRLGLVVRDRGSDLGTTVNNQYIGGIFAKDTCRLVDGVNTVVAGGIDSPFVFRIVVE